MPISLALALGLGLALALLWLLDGRGMAVTVASIPHAPGSARAETGAARPLEAGATTATLTHGPIVGGVTSSTAVIWVRASQAATVQIEHYIVQGGQVVTVTFPFSATAVHSRDFTAKVALSGLEPGTRYQYNVLVDGRRQLTVPYTFDTFPEPGVARDFCFAVLNDFADFRPHGERIHEDNRTLQMVDAESPAFVIIGGDFDHSDPTSTTLAATIDTKREMFRYLYRCEPAKFAHPYTDTSCLLIEHVFSKYPVAHMWDDHDYGRNDAAKTYEYSRTSLAVLDEYFPVYELSPDGLNAQLGPDGDWQAFSYGQADFFLLDSRSQRDLDGMVDGPDKSMLGVRQLDWLMRELSSSRATWKFILTPSVFNPTSGKPDSWAWFEWERQRILSFIETENITGVVLISGDMHFGGVDDGSNAGLPEMIVPSVNLSYCGPTNPDRFTGVWSGGTYEESPRDEGCPGYGVVQVATNPDRVELQVWDETGARRLSCIVTPDYRADCAAPPSTTFLKYYQQPGGGTVRDALQTDDGGYVMVGDTDVLTGTGKPLIVKVADDGEFEWAASLPGITGTLSSVDAIAGVGYAVVGNRTISTGLSCGWMGLFDTVGHLNWGQIYNLCADSFVVSLQKLSPRNWLAGGSLIGEGRRGLLVMQVKPVEGTIEDQAAFDVPARIHGGGSLIRNKVRNWGGLLVGSLAVSATLPGTTTLRSDEQLVIIRFNLNLEPEWARLYGDAASDEGGMGIVQLPGGGYVVAGYKVVEGGGRTDEDMWVLRLDAEGDVVWQRTYGGPYDDAGLFLARARYADQWVVMIAGEYAKSPQDSDIWVVKLDPAGEVLSQYAYGSGNVDAARFIHATRDGGYVGGGVWNLTSTAGLTVGLPILFKLDGNGAVYGCEHRSEPAYTTTQTTSPFQALSVPVFDPYVAVDGALETTQTPVISPTVVCQDPLCLSIAKVGPSSVLTGGLVTYTLTVTNSGSVTVTGLVITDPVPVGAHYVGGGAQVGGAISWTVASVTAGERARVTFAVTTTEGIINVGYRASADEDHVVTGPAVVTTIRGEGARAALRVTKEVRPVQAQPGAPLTYTIRVANTGDVDLHAAITDTLLLSVTLGEISDETLVLPGGRAGITWTTVITAPGGVWMETIVVTPAEGRGGPLTNLVEVTTEEGVGGIAWAIVDPYRVYLPLVLRER